MIAILLLSCLSDPEPLPPARRPAHPQEGSCLPCHEEQAMSWRRSHHALAHAAPTDARFDGRPVHAGDLIVRPVREEGKRWMVVEDAAGRHRLPVWRSIGVEPLQQLLLDAGGGRRLVAPIAWDVAAGQWYDPSVDGASGDPGDRMYWAGILGTWNHMCADCHSTGLRKGWTPQGYETVEQAPHVSCVACHPQGGAGPVQLDEQVNTCGPCHARGERVAHAGSGADLLDQIVPAGLEDPVLRADGSPGVDEPFELLPYLSGAMGRAGLPCTTCHDPHSLQLRAPAQALCTGCHPADHAHPGPPAVGCEGCHAPTTRYMGRHDRHDHRFSSPGPRQLRACAACHEAAEQAWASSPWAERPPDPRWVALEQLRGGAPAAVAALPEREGPWRVAAVASGAVRGVELEQALGSDDPWVRHAALRSPVPLRPDLLLTALQDPVRAVRYRALRRWIEAGGAFDADLPGLLRVAGEWEAFLTAEGDVSTRQLNLAVLRLWRGELEGARRALERAVALDPTDLEARAMLERLRALGGNDE